MIVHKYRDVIRMTLFGRHDKNVNDTTSIYQGYDRYATTTTGGGVNAITVSNNERFILHHIPSYIYQMHLIHRHQPGHVV